MLEALQAPGTHDGARPLLDGNRENDPVRLGSLGHDRFAHLGAHPSVQLVVTEDRGEVLVELFLHEVPGLDVGNASLARRHQVPELLGGNRCVALERDLLHLQVRALVDEDLHAVSVRRLGDRIFDPRPVVTARLEVPPLVLDVLKDEVLVENLALEERAELGPQLLLLHSGRLEHDAWTHGDPVNRHDPAVVRRLSRNELHRSLEAILLVEIFHEPGRVIARLRFAVSLPDLQLEPASKLVRGEGLRIAVEERGRDGGDLPRHDPIDHSRLELLLVEGDLRRHLRIQVALRLEPPLEIERSLLHVVRVVDRPRRKSDRSGELLARKLRADEAQRLDAVGPEEMDDDGDSARDGGRLDFDVRETARREEVADRCRGRLVRERLPRPDLDQPCDLIGVDGPVRGVGDGQDGRRGLCFRRRLGLRRRLHLLRHEQARHAHGHHPESPRQEQSARAAARPTRRPRKSQCQYLVRRRTSTRYTPFSSRPARRTTVLLSCHSTCTIGGLDVSRDCE